MILCILRVATDFTRQAIQGRRQLSTIKYDHGWVAKVWDRVYRQQNELIYGLLGFTGALRALYGCILDSTGLFVLYGSFWVLSLLCLLPPITSFLCPYAGPTYSIVLTIVHFDGTSILSLYSTCCDLRSEDLK
jgi:hypothetical protein